MGRSYNYPTSSYMPRTAGRTWHRQKMRRNTFPTLRTYKVLAQRMSMDFRRFELLSRTCKPDLPGTSRNVLKHHDGSHLGLQQQRPVVERSGHARAIRIQYFFRDSQGTIIQGIRLIQPSLECEESFQNERVEMACISATKEVINNTALLLSAMAKRG